LRSFTQIIVEDSEENQGFGGARRDRTVDLYNAIVLDLYINQIDAPALATLSRASEPIFATRSEKVALNLRPASQARLT
jgi:hypothetical protein